MTAEKWKAKSTVLGNAVTEALVEYLIHAEAKAAIERYRVGNEIRFGADVALASGKA